MPWYRVGSVSITAGQNTVTGTGTNFSTNARVGDAFQGPDGRWYEVTNIASATVLSILPAYQGATVSAGAYGLAPMQGYVKESADRLRQLVDQFGATLAGLGTVSTENVVPVAKGGTGGTTPGQARAGLELGNAALANVTASATDSTAGRLLKVGDFGLGAGQTPTLSDMTAAWVFASYIVPANAPGLPAEAASTGGVFLSLRTNFGVLIQLAVGASSRKVWTGARSGATGAVTWSKVVSNEDIVGTVSQSGGVPTGAVIERGSNTNGEYTRYADGTQETWGLVTQPSGQSSQVVHTFPMPFVSPPVSVAQARGIISGTTGGSFVSECGITNNTMVGVKVLIHQSTAIAAPTSDVGIGVKSIGRWF